MIIRMKLRDKPFYAIKNRTKTIEMRLWDEKRKNISAGDVIEFVRYDNPKEIIYTKVEGIHIYPTFKELYRDYRKEELGYQADEKANPADMEEYYPLFEQEKYCVVGIEIRLIDKDEV